MTFYKKTYLSTVLMGMLTACSTSDIASNEENVEKQQRTSQRAKGEFNLNTKKLEQAPYSYSEDFFVIGGAYEMTAAQPLPAAFDMQTSFNRIDPMDLDSIIDTLNKRYQKYGVVINLSKEAREHIDSTLSSSSTSTTSELEAEDSTGITPISTIDTSTLEQSIQTNGYTMILNVKDASLRHILDLITANTDTWWRFEDGRVTMYRDETETFMIDTSSREFDRSFSQTASSDGEDNSSGSSFTASDGGSNALDDINAQVELMLTDTGQAMVNKYDHTLTVTDTPTSLKKVRKFVKNYNYRSTTNYSIVIDVFEIISEITDEKGVDWGAVFQTTGSGNIGFNTPSFVSDATKGGLDSALIFGNWNVTAVTEFLNKNASMFSHIQKFGKTRNNFPSIMASIEDRGIVSGRSVTIDSNGFSQESIETKIIDEGFSITATPRLTSMGRIDMDVTLNSKVITDVSTFGSEDEEVQLEKNRKVNDMFNVVMRDGTSAVISGYERYLTSADVQSLAEEYPWWTGGQNNKRRYKANLMIVVHPTILER